MINFFRKKNSLFLFFAYNSLAFTFFLIIFLLFPKLDIIISNFFFLEGKFLSDKYIFIKDLRAFLKNLMICIPILALVFLLKNIIDKKRKIIDRIKFRTKFFCIGLILGPILGSGLIANLYFKENWGRARPVHIEEFGGTKNFTPAFIKSDQCETNCSWISGETSAAFSFVMGTIILKNSLFFVLNIILGILVFFCRLTMGGHFFTDNIFSVIFMFYIAIIYRILVSKFFK
ncbi:MAG: hypothetical protein CMP34_01045 [Rickettsiales bacterium]|nr:hypothetical protein [Rickettsiales bacterium]